MSSGVNIVGWAHTRFGRRPDEDLESLLTEVAGPAIADAGLSVADVDAIFVGVFNNGFSKQGFEAALVGAGMPELATLPATRLENACATGSAALFAAIDRIEAGRARAALVLGAEKMTDPPAHELNSILLSGSHRRTEESAGSFAGIFAGLADRYADRYGDPHGTMAALAAKNHRNGVANPYAHLRPRSGRRVLRHCVGEESGGRRPAAAHRLLARIRWGRSVDSGQRRCRQDAPACRSHPWPGPGRRPPPRSQLGPTRWPSTAPRAPSVRRMAEADVQAGRSRSPRNPRLLHHRRAAPDGSLWTGGSPGKAADLVSSGATGARRSPPGQRLGRAEGQGSPDRRHRRLPSTSWPPCSWSAKPGRCSSESPERAAVFNMGGAGVANYATVLERSR